MIEKNNEEMLRKNIDPIEDLENIVDEAIEEVKNLKEGKEIYPETVKPIEKQIPKEAIEQFEELEKQIKEKERVRSD